MSNIGAGSSSARRVTSGGSPASMRQTPPWVQARKSIHPAPVPNSPASASYAACATRSAEGMAPSAKHISAATAATVSAALLETPAATGAVEETPIVVPLSHNGARCATTWQGGDRTAAWPSNVTVCDPRLAA